MAEFEITCARCNAKIEHVCHEELCQWLVRMLRIKVPAPRGFKSSPFYAKGDENAPFYTEAFLYSLLGKEDGRTICYSFDRLIQLCGFDPMQLRHEAEKYDGG
jgi:hypothetical protein